jgi:hypothetical protein
MRTTIELPDEVLIRAKKKAAETGQTLREFFQSAVEEKLAKPRKTRREPPIVGGADGPTIGDLTAEQIDEALFG